ncbi:hypothetical protein SRO_7557 [Streptomyces rochei]|nr:hypothetical protein SRO_0012 [Streptomyces rochei]BBC98733.1 hypothetical protein SRO_7557 [Streptomyces rochei]
MTNEPGQADSLKYVLFDIDRTLTDTVTNQRRTWGTWAGRYGLDTDKAHQETPRTRPGGDTRPDRRGPRPARVPGRPAHSLAMRSLLVRRGWGFTFHPFRMGVPLPPDGAPRSARGEDPAQWNG